MLTVFAFIVAIGVLVIVHEYGHYALARACGVKVLRFSIGFGPRIAGWTSAGSGTEFVLCLLPLGGYVKMLDERESEVPANELSMAFNVQPLSRRAAIVAAGPVANLLLAVVLYTCVYWSGLEQAQPIVASPVAGSVAAKAGMRAGDRVLRAGFDGSTLSTVVSFDELRWWLTRGALERQSVYLEYVREPFKGSTTLELDFSQLNSTQADEALFRSIGILSPMSQAMLGDISVDGAAAQAGLQAGDRVFAVDENPIADAAQLRGLIRESGMSGSSRDQVWNVQRGASAIQLTVRPIVVQGENGAIGRVGAMIGTQPQTVKVRYGPVDGLLQGVVRAWEVSQLTLHMMGQIVTGNASLKNLSGPITIADYAGKSASLGFTQYLVFLALISISLGVLNLLPLPVLDGGHLVYYLWEFLTGKPVSDFWMDSLQRAGLALLFMMMSIAVFNDVTRLIG